MGLDLIIDLLHTGALLVLTYNLVNQKRINKALVDRINICARNPIKARKQKPIEL